MRIKVHVDAEHDQQSDVLYENYGKIKKAKAMYRQALKGYEKACGPEHTSMLDTVTNLGILCINQGKTKEAEVMFRRAKIRNS